MNFIEIENVKTKAEEFKSERKKKERAKSSEKNLQTITVTSRITNRKGKWNGNQIQMFKV